MRTLGRWACVVLVGAVSVLALAMPATAQEAGGQGDGEYAPTMLVLDASGSMAEADPGGGTKMDAAKRAAHTVIDSAPDGSRLGLTVYGTGTGSSDAEKEAGCQDVTVLRPADELDKAALGAAVDGLTPRGYTPIGTSLRTAADALPKEGPRAVVLVSDGEDTCAPPDPCEVAKELAQQGVDLVVHAVGFGVDDTARAQLTCIAQATGGTYTDAPDAGSLEDTLPRVTATALRNYQAEGTPVTGTDEYSTAPEVTPGQYLDTIGKEETRFYAIDVPQGATLYAAATISFRRGSLNIDLDQLAVAVLGHDGGGCPWNASNSTGRTAEGSALSASVTADGATLPPEDLSECYGGGRYFVKVTWSPASAGQPSRMPIELLFGLEPEVTGDKGPAPAEDSDLLAYSDPGGADRPVTGGGSFGTAATLDGAGHYTDVVRSGEFVFYRVRLDWGQALAYRVLFGEPPKGTKLITNNVSTTMYTPFRAGTGWLLSTGSSGAYDGSGGTYLPGEDEAIATVPIRYRNREADNSDYHPQSVAGWYYIAVQVGLPEQGDRGAPVPVTLDVSVGGSPQDGPGYEFASEDEKSAGVFGDSERKQDKPAPATTAAPERTDSRPVAWVIGGGAVVVAAVAAIVLATLLRRRRARRVHW